MGVVYFGLVMFLIVLPASWLLEKLGIMEVPDRAYAIRPYGAREVIDG